MRNWRREFLDTQVWWRHLNEAKARLRVVMPYKKGKRNKKKRKRKKRKEKKREKRKKWRKEE
jgi:hypothetical protein